MRTSSPLKGPVRIVASTTLLINFLRAVAKLWLVDVSQHDNWHADFQLQALRGIIDPWLLHHFIVSTNIDTPDQEPVYLNSLKLEF
jgi:hypothetical protein